jgi:uncharacterized protein YydD (DUF2326 family)
MIRKIYASDKRFKEVIFEKGLNIILADRSEESSNKDTRNGAGKTSLINIIHFCLGGELKKLDLPIDDIKKWYFYIELDLCGKTILARRGIENHKIITVSDDAEVLPIAPSTDKESGDLIYNNEDWKKLLGICLFNLNDNRTCKYTPSFRSLISYFIRRGVEAYSSPFWYIGRQRTSDWQIHNAFLLGLNWSLASSAQEIRDKEEVLSALLSAIKVGLTPSQGELEADRVRLERKIYFEGSALNSFKVHPQYDELQKKSDTMTEIIHKISDHILILQKKLSRYEDSVSSEKVPSTSSVEKLYAQAGLIFSDTIKKSLDEAKIFHETVIKNRKSFLNAEISQIKNQITKLNNELEKYINDRAELMQLLKTHGALEEFSKLQNNITQETALLENIKIKLSEKKEFLQKKNELKAKKFEFETNLQRDYDESKPNWEKAIALFNENSLALYDEPGNLIINTSNTGYKFDVEIQKSTSEGIGKMKIFCYDLMLVELMASKGLINFLVHDSTIYDGVDSRQRAHALSYAHKKGLEDNFQYICSFNSDMIPYEDFEEDFDIKQFVRLRLGDQQPSDSLFGFHFELKNKKLLQHSIEPHF